MYTHTGVKGASNSCRTVDPAQAHLFHRRHACTVLATGRALYAGITYYKGLCGVELAIQDDATRGGDTVAPASAGERITCKRCACTLATSQLCTRGTAIENATHALAAWEQAPQSSIYASGTGGYAVGHEQAIGWMYRAYGWTLSCPEELEALLKD